MAKFDWPRFLRQHNIEFVTQGPNTARHHVSIRCPWCGESDPSQHMGISLRGLGWGCLRNSAHRGKSIQRLVQRLLGCSPEEARRVAGVAEALTPTGDDLANSFALLKQRLGVQAPARSRGELKLPDEFKPLLNGSPFAGGFVEYLRGRGYRDAQIKWLAENYKLHYATRGAFAYRLIIPVYDRYGSLMTWTGRAIQSEMSPRYKTLRMSAEGPDDTGPVARIAANETILGLPVLWEAPNPKALVLSEGPLDGIKLTAFGHKMGLYGAALFGLNAYASQVADILDLSRRFERTYLLLDADAELHRLRLLTQLAAARPTVLKMPEGSDDPGAMTGGEVVSLAMNLVG